MFRRVALITFANVLVINQILLTNKQMICRHLTFTFHFYFSGILSEFLKRTTPPGCFPILCVSYNMKMGYLAPRESGLIQFRLPMLVQENLSEENCISWWFSPFIPHVTAKYLQPINITVATIFSTDWQRKIFSRQSTFISIRPYNHPSDDILPQR